MHKTAFRIVRQIYRLALLSALITLVPMLANGQPSSVETSSESTSATPAQLEAHILAIQESTTLDDATKNQLLLLFNQGLEQIRAAGEWQRKAEQFEKLRVEAPQRLEARREELLASTGELSPEALQSLDNAAGMSITELELKVADAEAQLREAQSQQSEIEQESLRRTERRRQIPALQVNTRARLEAARSQTTDSVGAGDGAEQVEARRILNEAKFTAAEQELRAYTRELASFDARGRLIALRLDLATRNAQRSKIYLERWREALAAERQAGAQMTEAAARDALLEAANAPVQIRESVKALAEENAALSQARTGPDGVIERLARLEVQREGTSAKLAELDSDFDRLKKKVNAAGSSSVVGLLLRSHREKLPDVTALEREISKRQDKVASVQIEQIETEEKRRNLANIEDEIANVENQIVEAFTGYPSTWGMLSESPFGMNCGSTTRPSDSCSTIKLRIWSSTSTNSPTWMRSTASSSSRQQTSTTIYKSAFYGLGAAGRSASTTCGSRGRQSLRSRIHSTWPGCSIRCGWIQWPEAKRPHWS
jgi:potassium-dependent mechanosensitive channel